MSHEISSIDKQQGRAMAWHGLTEVREDLTLADNWLRTWDVEHETLFTGKGLPIMAEEGQQWSVLRCSDNPAILIGRPFNPGTFVPITNAEFLDLIAKAVAGVDYQVESVLSCKERGRVAVSLRLGDAPKYQIGDREFEAFLSFGQGHDQSCQLYAVTSNICTVCNNTFTMNLQHQGGMVNLKIKHTKNVKAEIVNLPEIIAATIETQAAFAAAFAGLAEVQVKHSEAKAFLVGALVSTFKPEAILAPDFALPVSTDAATGEKTPWTIPTRTVNRVDRMLELFHDDRKGNHGRDLSDVFSAITDYFTHESAGEDPEKQFTSSEFGAALKAKQELFSLITDVDRRTLVTQAGDKLLGLIG